MKKVQVLQNLGAKIVLDMPKYSSATEALVRLGWDNLTKRRRFHRLILFFKALNGLIDWNVKFHIVIGTLTITILEEETIFNINPHHVALGAKTVLVIKSLMTGTSFLMKLKIFLTF